MFQNYPHYSLGRPQGTNVTTVTVASRSIFCCARNRSQAPRSTKRLCAISFRSQSFPWAYRAENRAEIVDLVTDVIARVPSIPHDVLRGLTVLLGHVRFVEFAFVLRVYYERSQLFERRALIELLHNRNPTDFHHHVLWLLPRKKRQQRQRTSTNARGARHESTTSKNS